MLQTLLSKESKENSYACLILTFYSVTALDAPAPPPGLQVQTDIAPDKPLNPKGFFLVITQMMVTFATHHPWVSFIDQGGKLDVFRVTMEIEPNARAWLKASHTVLGINQAAIAVVQKPLIHGRFTQLSIHGELLPLGNITIYKSGYTP